MGLFFSTKKVVKRQWPSVIKNASISGNIISLHREEDFSTNSTLVVQPGEEAIFVKNGVIEQVFTNGTYELKTENYPFLQKLIRMFSDGDSTFNCRVYFVRVASSVEIKWGTDNPIQLRDKQLGITTNVVARGAYKIQVCDSARFLTKLIGNGITSFGTNDITLYFQQEFLSEIKTAIATTIEESDTEILGIVRHQKEIGEGVSTIISDALAEYGVELLKFVISAIDVANDDLRRAYDERNIDRASTVRDINAYGENNWRTIQTMDILKQAASNSGGNSMVSEGVGLGAGIGIGGAISSMAQNVMQQSQPAVVPPPVSQWYIYLNGQQLGPMPLAQVQQYIASGQMSRSELVWKAGFPSWVSAESVPEIAQLFAQVPPTPPMPPVK